jgi:2-polyprenyl-6-methoxyphenol hydroxylase-like FAD-dependent oxidoreductase
MAYMDAAGKESQIDALVVGAGPVGLTMAADVARHGLSCRIIDKALAPTDKSKALVIWSRSLEMLAAMGDARPFIAAGTRAQGASMYSEGRRIARIQLQIESPYDYALMIPQCETERLLAEHLATFGLRVERQIELVDFQQDSNGANCTLRNAAGQTEQLRAAWLLGCDGAHSTVRHGLGIEFTGDAEPNDWMLADIHVRGPLPDDELSIYFHQSGLLAFFPIVGGRFRLIADLGPAKAGARPAEPTLAEVQQTLDERGPGGLTAFDPEWLSGFRIHERKVADYRDGRVFLAGDAAHIHSPAGGQGMNTGMQDAFNLAWKLALVERGRAGETLLDSYSLERSAVGDIVLRNAGAMTRVATLRNPLAQKARDTIYRLFSSWRIVQHGMSDSLSELSINYRHSPLSDQHRGLSAHAWLLGGGVHSGDRAPDGALISADTGMPTTLFETLRGSRHQLLLFTGVDPSADVVAELGKISAAVESRFPQLVASHTIAREPSAGVSLTDGVLAVHRRYAAAAPTLYLIRPDGYVSYRSQPAEASGLLAHLGKYLQ